MSVNEFTDHDGLVIEIHECTEHLKSE